MLAGLFFLMRSTRAPGSFIWLLLDPLGLFIICLVAVGLPHYICIYAIKKGVSEMRQHTSFQ